MEKKANRQTEYLTREAFFEYMGNFRTTLEGRLTSLEACLGEPGKNAGSYKEKLILILIGAVLALGGVAAGSTLL